MAVAITLAVPRASAAILEPGQQWRDATRRLATIGMPTTLRDECSGLGTWPFSVNGDAED